MIPKHILLKLRQRQGLEETDDSMDEFFESRPPMWRLREVVGWELGDPGWADQIIQWARDCGVEI